MTKTVDVRLARNARENALEDLRASLRREEVAVAQQATHDVRTTAAGLFKARLEGGPGEGQAVADGTEKLLAAIPKLRGATINAAMALGTAGRLAPLMEQITRSATTFVTSIGPAGDASSIEQAFSALSADLGGLERELVAGVEQRKGQE